MKKSKKILLSLTGLAAFATLPITAISCQTPSKQEEPKKEDVKTEEPKKDDIKAEESKVDPLIAKANEKARALAVASHFTFNLGNAYTKSTLLAALEEQGAALAYSYKEINIALFKGEPKWTEASKKQIFTVDKSLMTKENKASFQLANPDSPTYVSKKDNKTKINSILKHTLNKDAKTITLEFKGAFFIFNKDPIIGTETFSVTLPIELEDAPAATPGGTTPSTGDSGAQTNPKTENQGSEAQPGGAENQASPTPNGSTGETSTSQSGGSAQAAPSTNDQASGEQGGSAQPSTGAQNSGTGTTENSSGDTSGSGSGAGTSSTNPESTDGSTDNQAGAASTSSGETSTPGSQEGASTQTPPASSTSSQPSNTGTEASASQA